VIFSTIFYPAAAYRYTIRIRPLQLSMTQIYFARHLIVFIVSHLAIMNLLMFVKLQNNVKQKALRVLKQKRMWVAVITLLYR